MNMYSLLAASYELIFRKYPPRSLLSTISLSAAVGVYVFTLALDALYTLVTPDQSAFDRNISLAMVVLDIPMLIFVVLFTTWLINRYTHASFSVKEVFVLEIFLSAAFSIIMTVIGIGSMFATPAVATAGSVVGFVFMIYMLLTFQSAISQIASITKTKAAYVIVFPLFLFIVLWLAFLAVIEGVAALL